MLITPTTCATKPGHVPQPRRPKRQRIHHSFADNQLINRPEDRNLTQATLAERANTHVTQIRRYEAGTSTPTLDVLRNLALALNTSADSLLFDETERGPTNHDLKLHLEAINHLNHLDQDEQTTIITLIEGALLRHQARKLAG